jgi:hypothetical protein
VLCNAPDVLSLLSRDSPDSLSFPAIPPSSATKASPASPLSSEIKASSASPLSSEIKASSAYPLSSEFKASPASPASMILLFSRNCSGAPHQIEIQQGAFSTKMLSTETPPLHMKYPLLTLKH